MYWFYLFDVNVWGLEGVFGYVDSVNKLFFGSFVWCIGV